jgi:D-arabinitol dehydrogenase (NADP+)
MRAVVYDQPHAFAVRDVPDPQPGPGEVVLRTAITGVCGTDVHLHAGEFGPTYPLIPGHEIVGEVERVGEAVDHLAPGALVAVDNLIACGWCGQCRSERPQLCEHALALGVTGPGGFATRVACQARKCHPVDDLPREVAVMAEPTACAIHGADVLRLQPGADVLVFGAGPTGIVLTQLLVHGGAARVTVAAPTAFKLDLVRAYGADETVLVRRDDPDAAATRLRELAPSGFDVVVDATGALPVLEQCIGLTRDGGTVFVYGMAGEADRLAISPYEVFRRELTIKGSFAQAYGMERALAVLRSRRVRTEGIVTHRFGLDDYGAALAAVQGDRDCLKAVVLP